MDNHATWEQRQFYFFLLDVYTLYFLLLSYVSVFRRIVFAVFQWSEKPNHLEELVIAHFIAYHYGLVRNKWMRVKKNGRMGNIRFYFITKRNFLLTIIRSYLHFFMCTYMFYHFFCYKRTHKMPGKEPIEYILSVQKSQ